MLISTHERCFLGSAEPPPAHEQSPHSLQESTGQIQIFNGCDGNVIERNKLHLTNASEHSHVMRITSGPPEYGSKDKEVKKRLQTRGPFHHQDLNKEKSTPMLPRPDKGSRENNSGCTPASSRTVETHASCRRTERLDPTFSSNKLKRWHPSLQQPNKALSSASTTCTLRHRATTSSPNPSLYTSATTVVP